MSIGGRKIDGSTDGLFRLSSFMLVTYKMGIRTFKYKGSYLDLTDAYHQAERGHFDCGVLTIKKKKYQKIYALKYTIYVIYYILNGSSDSK